MIRLAIIGTGGMSHSHAEHFKEIAECTIVACSDVVPGKAKAFAEIYGIPAAYEDTAEMFKREDIDAVSVVTPDKYHIQPVLMAIEQGKHVMCEKPLATNLEDAKTMARAAAERGVLTSVNFSYRDNPATQKAHEMVAAGTIGRVRQVQGSYLQAWLVSPYWGDWKSPDMLWKVSTKHGSMGALGDIGVHLFDLTTFVAGDIRRINCLLKTFDKGVDRIGEYIVDANDCALEMIEFENGGVGVLDTSRIAIGRENPLTLQVYGDKGAIDLDLDRPQPDTLRLCVGENVNTNTWEQVECPPTSNMYRRFIDSIVHGRQAQTSFDGAVKVQACLDTSARSAESGKWETLGQL